MLPFLVKLYGRGVKVYTWTVAHKENRIACLRAGSWKLRGARRGFERDRCFLCMEGFVVQICMKDSGRMKRRERFLSSIWIR
jgi:hypothetical protein